MRDPSAIGLHQLEFDLRTGQPGSLDALIKLAEDATHNESDGKAIELAHTLMRAVPALGLLVARGCIASRSVLNDNLLRGIEETRDTLNLPPGDPGWDVHAALKNEAEVDDADDERERLADEARTLRGSLRLSSTRLDDLERQLAAKQAALVTARAAPKVIASSTALDCAERERLRSLKAKVEELQGLVREGNAERSDLRRQLAATTSVPNTNETNSVPPIADVADDSVCSPLPETTRDVSIPNITRRARDAFASVASAVAAEALRTIGSLGAGDASAWCRVKQAKDMPRQILMARIGIHNRLLFRADGGGLDVLDLVTREDLIGTLKRLRTSQV
jgi:hypothetical protein